jgi:hypothetical protein
MYTLPLEIVPIQTKRANGGEEIKVWLLNNKRIPKSSLLVNVLHLHVILFREIYTGSHTQICTSLPSLKSFCVNALSNCSLFHTPQVTK